MVTTRPLNGTDQPRRISKGCFTLADWLYEAARPGRADKGVIYCDGGWQEAGGRAALVPSHGAWLTMGHGPGRLLSWAADVMGNVLPGRLSLTHHQSASLWRAERVNA